MTAHSDRAKLTAEKGSGRSWLKSLRNYWRFGFKNTEPESQSLCHRKLIELSSKWFLETCALHIVQNGCFPAWFAGFIAREDAEEILKEKQEGCFLIRISDKAIGYVLSYRGRDRCRHLVIKQSDAGRFVVCGAAEEHDTVPDIIRHYSRNPIEPFGEYLKSSCFEAPANKTYDVIQATANKTYDVIQHGSHSKAKNKVERNSEQPKSKRTVEEVPPLPRRVRHHVNIEPSDPNRMLYAKVKKKPTRNLHASQQQIHNESLPGAIARRTTTGDQNSRKCRPLSAQEYSLLCSADLTSGPRGPQSSHSIEHLNDGADYFLAGMPGSLHTECKETKLHRNLVYAGIHAEAFRGSFSPDDIYEIIPGIGNACERESNTYESVGDVNRLLGSK
ncbi:SH2 domain-containing protein 7-like [Syngnathus scovelli]|uniref:SH2 domain-containing protein 7-like n=1 Tax=Syngnathus scovelli TaxID=161590 RepID=UPI002110416F|nr:SH2 domain-containing protein 7-like [Syngnathus scovelli]XP_049579283.1 SH2 domain-containing protein 7-like [Syngnathus scovelli]